MSRKNWTKRWLFDSTIEIPKVTKWRRKVEVNTCNNDEEIGDVRGDFATEACDLGSNTSPLKKPRTTLGDCLPSSSKKIELGKSFKSSNTASQMAIRSAEGIIRINSTQECVHNELVDCVGESIELSYFKPF